MTQISTTNVYEFDNEDAALSFIEEEKKANSQFIVEHSLKHKAKKDRKTGEVIEETWTVSIKVKYEV